MNTWREIYSPVVRTVPDSVVPQPTHVGPPTKTSRVQYTKAMLGQKYSSNKLQCLSNTVWKLSYITHFINQDISNLIFF